MKKLILLLLSIISLSCNFDKDINNLNSKINTISNLYQAEVTYKITKKLKFDVKQDILLVKVTLNDVLRNRYKDKYYIPASNIAYTLFKDLPDQKFDTYTVEFFDRNSKVMEKVYEKENLEKLMKKIPVFDRISLLLKRQEYEQIYNMFNKEYLELSKEQFVGMFKQFDSITDIKYEGYLYGNLTIRNVIIPYIACFETIHFSDEELPIYIVIDEDKNQLVSIQADWQ